MQLLDFVNPPVEISMAQYGESCDWCVSDGYSGGRVRSPGLLTPTSPLLRSNRASTAGFTQLIDGADRSRRAKCSTDLRKLRGSHAIGVVTYGNLHCSHLQG